MRELESQISTQNTPETLWYTEPENLTAAGLNIFTREYGDENWQTTLELEDWLKQPKDPAGILTHESSKYLLEKAASYGLEPGKQTIEGLIYKADIRKTPAYEDSPLSPVLSITQPEIINGEHGSIRIFEDDHAEILVRLDRLEVVKLRVAPAVSPLVLSLGGMKRYAKLRPSFAS
jgi:hypothetical protein